MLRVEKREEQRTRKRITCELVIDGKGSPGIVHDVSAAGLFIQTRARPKPGMALEVVLRPEAGTRSCRFEASVARQRVVPTRLQSSLPGGVGLVVEDPPDGFQQLVAEWCGTEAPVAAEDKTGIRTYRVRVKERNKPRARVITERCESAQAARARALRQVGSGWTVAEIKEL